MNIKNKPYQDRRIDHDEATIQRRINLALNNIRRIQAREGMWAYRREDERQKRIDQLRATVEGLNRKQFLAKNYEFEFCEGFDKRQQEQRA